MYQITFTCMTTEGPHSNTSEPIEDLDIVMASVDGIIAGVGASNVIAINIVVV